MKALTSLGRNFKKLITCKSFKSPNAKQTITPSKERTYLFGIFLIVAFAIQVTSSSGVFASEDDDIAVDETLDIIKLNEIEKALSDGYFPKNLWFDLGLQLGLIHNELSVIEENYPRNTVRCLQEMLSVWLRRGEATWSKLAIALKNLDYKVAADAVMAKFRVLESIGQKPVAEGIDSIKSEEQKPYIKSEEQKPAAESTWSQLSYFLNALKNNSYDISTWRDLCLSLGLNATTLNTIEKYKGNSEDCLKSCLAKAITNERLNWSSLNSALTRIGQKTIIPKSTIDKWLNEGSVNLTVTRINMHGLPGSGKSCAQLLLLNEDPPHNNVTNSTPIARPTVRATRVSVDDKKWERVTRQELLHRLASHLNETAMTKTDDETLQQSQVFNHSVNEASTINKTQQQKSNAANDDPRNVINDEVLPIPRGIKGFKRKEEWLYIIDSGGQPAYQELLPLFTRAASLNIITIDLSKPLDEEIELMYRIGGKSYPCYSKSTQLTSFQSVVSSGAIYRPLNIRHIKEHPSRSMHLVLGTHYDKVHESTFEECDKTLIKSVKGLGSYLRDFVIKKSDDSVIFPVNTLAKGEERTKHSQEVCQAIQRFGSDASLTIEIPIRWFAFELSISNYSSIITLEKALGIGEKYEMNEEDTKLALNYLHKVTLILYYPEVLDGVVFTDPQPILEFISQLLALTYINDNEALNFISAKNKKFSPADDINKLKNGFFKEELFHKLESSKMFSSKFNSSDLLKLLLYLNIIAEVQEKNEYFIPYALPSYSTSNLSLPQEKVNHSKPLRILYRKEPDQILPIPQGIFPLVIVNLLKQANYKVAVPSRDEPEYYKYRDAMSLWIEINSYDLIHIIKKFMYIEVYYTGPKNDSLIVRELVMKAVRDSSNAINVEHAGYLHSAFGCQNKGTCIVTDEKNLKTICPESPSDKCTIDDRYSCWFDTNSVTVWDKYYLSPILKIIVIIAIVYFYPSNVQEIIGQLVKNGFLFVLVISILSDFGIDIDFLKLWPKIKGMLL